MARGRAVVVVIVSLVVLLAAVVLMTRQGGQALPKCAILEGCDRRVYSTQLTVHFGPVPDKAIANFVETHLMTCDSTGCKFSPPVEGVDFDYPLRQIRVHLVGDDLARRRLVGTLEGQREVTAVDQA